MANRDPREPGSAAAITPMKIVAVEGSQSAVADTDPAPPPKPNTDPGVAPPPGPAMRARDPQRSQGVRVPGSGQNDSVEELLGNMAETPKPPPRSAPDSSGKAAVAYHAQHGLHPGQVTPVPEPKVIVEKVALMQTLRLDRSKLPPAVQAATAPRRAEPTVEIPRAQGPRVLVALFSAVLVVFGIFIVLKLWSVKQKQNAVATDPTATALVEPASSAQVGAGAAVAVAPTAPTAPTAVEPATADTEVSPAPSAPLTVTASAAAVAPATTTTARAAAPPATTGPWSAPPATAPDNPYAPGTATATAPKTDVKRTIN
jgi:hypothetical protein